MRINNNLMAMNTHRAMGSVQGGTAKSMEKLSSGYRINRAGDDAAGLAISEKMRGQIRGLNQASRNSQDGISMIQTAEGALNETQAILQRMRELAVQSANDTNVDADRGSIQNEIDQLSTEITRISDTTEFNTQKLLNGSLSDIKFQIGANENQDMGLAIGDMRAKALKVVTSKAELDVAGAGVKGVQADVNFDVDGVTVEAVAGGALAAEISSKNVTTTEYAADVTVSNSTGVTNSQNLTFNDAGVTLTADTDVAWDKLNTSGALSDDGLKIGFSGGQVTVKIDVASSGDGAFSAVDVIDANASGNFVYDNHGVSFTISAEEASGITASGDVFVVAFDEYKPSGDSVDMVGNIAGNGNISTTLSGSNDIAFSGAKIAMAADSAQWLDGAAHINVSGVDMEVSGAGSIVVTITDGAGNELSKDTFTLESGDAFFSGNGTADFTYENHGVSFKITDFGNTKDFELSEDIDYIEKSIATTTADDFKFNVTDSSNASKAVIVNLTDNSSHSISGVVNEINIASSGVGAGAVATLDGDKIVISAATSGAASEVTITASGFLAGNFSTITKDGSDESIDLTLKDSVGATIDTQSIAGDAGAVTFDDADGNELEFTLEKYSDLSDVNVSDEFGVDKLNRIDSGIDVSSQATAATAITTINNAIETVSSERSKLGAVQNRLEHTIANLDASAENLQASESRIRDVDMAKEMMEFTKNNILQQAAQSMLAQANQAPQGVLQLLR